MASKCNKVMQCHILGGGYTCRSSESNFRARPTIGNLQGKGAQNRKSEHVRRQGKVVGDDIGR